LEGFGVGNDRDFAGTIVDGDGLLVGILPETSLSANGGRAGNGVRAMPSALSRAYCASQVRS